MLHYWVSSFSLTSDQNIVVLNHNLDVREKFQRLKVKLKDEGYFPNFHSTFLSHSMTLQEVKQTVAGNQVSLLATMS